MSEEEKEALENLKHIIKYWKPNDKSDELANIEYNSIKIAVNLIDKLQKENKEIKKDNIRLLAEVGDFDITKLEELLGE